MKLKLFSFLKLTIVVSLMALCSTASASPGPKVTNTADSGPGSLRYVITNTPAGGLIDFAANLTGSTIVLTNGELLLNTNVTIDASSLPDGIIINGNANGRIFEVDNLNATVTLNSLTITNGVAPNSGNNAEEGGGILNQGSLIVNRCIVAGNSAGLGGGIYNGGNLTMNQCTLSGNSGGNSGGAIDCQSSIMTLSNCTVSGNSSGYGAGIYLSEGSATLIQCTIVNNNNSSEGGGICSFLANVLTVNQCTVAFNSASSFAGGIYSQQASSFNVSNSIIAGNSGSGSGNDIFVNGGAISYGGSNLVQSVLGTRSGPTPLAGAPVLAPLGNYGGPTQTMPPLRNSPALDAGGPTTLTTDQRGFPRVIGAGPDLGAAEFFYLNEAVTNTADSGFGALRDIVNYSPAGATITFATNLSGQIITLTNGPVTLSTNIIIDGSALAGGVTVSGNNASSIFNAGPGATVSLVGLTLVNGNQYDGGAVYGSPGSMLYVSRCTFTGSTAEEGGGLLNDGGLQIENSTFSGNNASFGGAIECRGPATLINCTISANNAGDCGGIYNYYTTLTLDNSIVASNTDFTLNSDIHSESAALVLTNANLIQSSGGDVNSTVTGPAPLTNAPMLAALGNYGGPTQTMPPLTGSPAIGAGSNSVTNYFSIDQRGFPRLSGLGVDLGAVEIQAAVVTNTADSGPGSLRAEAAGYVDPAGAVTFAPNLSGQTVSLTSGPIILSNNASIDASALAGGLTVSGNHASNIFNVAPGATVSLTGLTLVNGSNYDEGGAVYGASGSMLYVSRCTFTGNTADEGGAIANNGALQIENSTFSGNYGSYGGAIECFGPATLINCTISANNAQNCGGIYNYFTTLTLDNCIVAANTDVLAAGNVYSLNGTLVLTNANLIQSSGSNGNSSTVSGPAPLTSPPMLAALGNYGGPTQTMPPLPGSPAIDAGGPTFLTIDQRGFPRVVGPAPDLGAVEFAYPNNPVVTNAVDGGPVSLRDIVNYSPAGATITFAPNLSGQIITLTNGPITLFTNITIDASALAVGVTVSGNNASGIFNIGPGATVSLVGLTLVNGNQYDGGAVYGSPGSMLYVSRCTFTGSTAEEGGALCNDGGLQIENSTFSGNYGSYGGAIECRSPTTLINCTISSNNAQDCGGIYNYHTTLTLDNCIIVANPDSTQITDIYSEAATLVFTNANLIQNVGSDGVSPSPTGPAPLTNAPMLAALGNYGGPTQTMPPLTGSPAIDAGSNSVTNYFSIDQRGFPRLSGLGVDLGAVEIQAAVVTNTADSGPGSLRAEAAVQIDPAGAVTFAPNLSGQVITLTNGPVTLSNYASIDASALAGGLTVSGNHASNIFNIAPGATVSLTGLTLVNGNLPGGAGGAVYSAPGSMLYVSRCTFTGNSANVGGALVNDGVLQIENSTFSGNYGGFGGALQCDSPATLINCTISANNGFFCGGIYNGATLTLNNSIVAANTDASLPSDIYSVNTAALVLTNANLIQNSGSNGNSSTVTGPAPLTGAPKLAALGNYGGSTQTMPPLPGSPAIDAGGPTFLTIDQRGFSRQVGVAPDLGAVEGIFNAAGPGRLTGVTRSGNGTLQFGFTNYTDTSFTVLASTNMALPLTNWTILGPAVESPIGSGNFQFTDPQATNYPKRFYRVHFP